MKIYDDIVTGLNEHKPASITTEAYLHTLQPSVRFLRKSYYSYPVSVPYHKQEIQASYLVAYLPHYYQLIYSILNNDSGEIFKNKTSVDLGFIGGGPGSEVYGAIKFILNNCPWVRNVNVYVFDINAETWKFSHGIVLKNLIGSIEGANKLSIIWNTVTFNLIEEKDVKSNLSVFKSLDLLVIQNCINEIALPKIPDLKKNIIQLFHSLPSNSYFLISDLTSSVRPLMKAIEAELEKAGGINFKVTTLNQPNPTAIVSVHHLPNKAIRENLMTGEDGLIPRKNLKYDYTLLSRMTVQKKSDKKDALGFMALYAPLQHNQIDANDFVHKKSFIGLDFGTSTTVVSCANLIDEKLTVTAIPIPQKYTDGQPTYDPLVPTVMCVAEGQFMIGRYAAERKSILEPGKNLWYGFKENLLTLQETDYPNSILKNHATKRIANAKEALIFFFRYLKDEVESYLANNQLPVDTEYSVSIPARFEFERKKIIRECLMEAGIPYEDTPFIEEPTAALINYLYESKDPISLKETSQNVLILDIGAGTVDVSIIQLYKQLEGINSKLLAVNRIGFIGGNLLDEMISKKLLAGIKQFELLSTPERSELLKLSENLKVKLSKEVETDSTVDYRLPNRAFSQQSVQLKAGISLSGIGIENVKLRFDDFHGLMKEYWHKISKTINEALTNADLETGDITAVILNGGGSRNPYIQNFTREYFDQSKIVRPDRIQEHVSKGAALNSFVLNSYGKQIVASILASPVYVWDGNIKTAIIASGETLPTFEVELYPELSSSNGLRQLNLIINDQSIYFNIPSNTLIEKILITINIDNEPECEIVTGDRLLRCQRSLNNIDGQLLKIVAP